MNIFHDVGGVRFVLVRKELRSTGCGIREHATNEIFFAEIAGRFSAFGNVIELIGRAHPFVGEHRPLTIGWLQNDSIRLRHLRVSGTICAPGNRVYASSAAPRLCPELLMWIILQERANGLFGEIDDGLGRTFQTA